MKRRNALDVIDSYVEDLMKRRPQDVADLMAFVDHLGTLSEAELEVEREEAAKRGARRFAR
jgi:hypothetical protein